MRARTIFFLLACIVGLCAAEPAARPAVRAFEPGTCESCEALVGSFEAYVSSANTQEVVTQFISSVVCTELPASLLDTCEQEISALYAQGVSYVVTSLPPESVCATFGSCAPPSLLSLLSSSSGSPWLSVPFECSLCRLVSTTLIQRLEDPTIREQIRGNLLAACGKLDAVGKAKCEADVSLLFASVDALAKDLDPNKACEFAKFCQPEAVTQALAQAARQEGAELSEVRAKMLEAARASPVPPTPVFVQALKEAFAALSSGDGLPAAQGDDSSSSSSSSSSLSAPSAASCDECKVLVAQVVSVLADPKTQAELLEFGKQACDAFPSFKDECVSYVTIYGPLALNVLLSYLQPDSLCASIGYCPVPPATRLGGDLLFVQA